MVEMKGMSALYKRFSHEEFGDLAVYGNNNLVFLRGYDVAKNLGFDNPWDAVRDHVTEAEKTFIHTETNFSDHVDIGITLNGVRELCKASKLPDTVSADYYNWARSDVILVSLRYFSSMSGP